MNFEAINQEGASAEKDSSIRERLVFPHVEAITSLLNKAFEKADDKDKAGYEADPEAVKDILWAFIEQRIEQAGVYRSEKSGAAFPYGVTDTADLAKKLYAQYAGPEFNGATLEANQEKAKMEFVFTSVPPVQSLSAGSLFAFMEEPMVQAIKDLPRAIAALKEGKEPDSHKIYNLGSPTNELGAMSPEFLEKLKGNKAFEEFGALYAEFIESTMPPEERKNTRLFLYGQSTGASFASETGARLIGDGAATQSYETEEKEGVPFMQIRLDAPVGSSDLPRWRKMIQIPVGFMADATYTLMTDPYLKPVMAGDKNFLLTAQGLLDERGLTTNLSQEQVALKKAGAWEVLNNLRAGTPNPEGLKVTKVVGGSDPLMWSNETREAIKTQKEEHGGSLGEGLITKKEGERTFGINAHHGMAYFQRPSELRRLAGAARALKGAAVS